MGNRMVRSAGWLRLIPKAGNRGPQRRWAGLLEAKVTFPLRSSARAEPARRARPVSGFRFITAALSTTSPTTGKRGSEVSQPHQNHCLKCRASALSQACSLWSECGWGRPRGGRRACSLAGLGGGEGERRAGPQKRTFTMCVCIPRSRGTWQEPKPEERKGPQAATPPQCWWLREPFRAPSGGCAVAWMRGVEMG